VQRSLIGFVVWTRDRNNPVGEVNFHSGWQGSGKFADLAFNRDSSAIDFYVDAAGHGDWGFTYSRHFKFSLVNEFRNNCPVRFYQT
jgi:hypothetical protein